MSVRDPSVWQRVEQAERDHPVPRKTLTDRTIYLPQQVPLVDGTAILTDFGSARMGQETYRGDVMPEVYRAPEVILDMEWDSKIDIWSVGVMVCDPRVIYFGLYLAVQTWDLFQGGRLFFARRNGMLDDEQHLAEMVSLMGPPPPTFLTRSDKCRQYWDDDGIYHPDPPARWTGDIRADSRNLQETGLHLRPFPTNLSRCASIASRVRTTGSTLPLLAKSCAGCPRRGPVPTTSSATISCRSTFERGSGKAETPLRVYWLIRPGTWLHTVSLINAIIWHSPTPIDLGSPSRGLSRRPSKRPGQNQSASYDLRSAAHRRLRRPR